MKKLSAILLATLALGGLQAQKALSGTLVGGAGKNSLPYANIALLRQADSTFVRGTTSDAQGRFCLGGDTVASLLRISAIGYETLFLPVDGGAAPQALDLGTVVMKEGATTLDAVSITAKKPMYAVDGEKSIYNVSEDPTIQNGSAQDALQNAPGVKVDGEGNLSLNGKEVTVYINDRKSHYSGEMLKQYIKTLTADQISSIEVMEYPSAKYGGGGPVINIRTGQNLLRNSYFSFGASGSSRPDVSPFASYAYANEKLRFDAYVRYSRDVWESDGDGGGTMLAEDSTEVRQYSYTSKGRSVSHDLSTSFSFGYDFDTMNTLSAYVSFSPSWNNNSDDERTIRTDLIGSTLEDFSFSRHSDSRNTHYWTYGNISFEHKFNNDGHSVTFSGSGYGGGSLGSNRSSRWEHYDAQPQLNFDERTLGSDNYRSISLEADYSYPYSDKGELSAGLGFNFGGDNACYLRDTLGADGGYRCDALLSDSSRSPEYEGNLYLSWRRKFGNLTLRLGNSMAYSVSNNFHVHSPEYDTTVADLTFSPRVTLMYRTESMHSFTLNYSTYVSTPSARQLSRYEDYGTDSYSTGNPALKNSYSHDLGVSYSKYFENGNNLGISANGTVQFSKIRSLSMPAYNGFFGRYVMHSMPYNVGDTRSGRIRAYGTLRFSALFSATLNLSVSDDWYKVQLRPDEWFENELASWQAWLSVRVKVFNLVWVSVSGDYNSRSFGWSVLEVNEPRWSVNASASADLFDRKLSFYLNISDIFNTSRWDSSSINPYAPSTSNYKSNSQYITFGVTLRFGKMELGNSSKEGIQESGSAGGRR